MGVFSGWFEGILLSVTFIAVLTLAIVSFNVDYGQSYTTPLTDNTTMSSFVTYMNTSQKEISSGNVLTGSIIGVNIRESYTILTGAVNLIWNFISGGFLNNVGIMLGLGEAGMLLIGVLRVIWFCSLIFGLLYIFFKSVIVTGKQIGRAHV